MHKLCTEAKLSYVIVVWTLLRHEIVYVCEWLLFQLYHSQNKLPCNEIMYNFY